MSSKHKCTFLRFKSVEIEFLSIIFWNYTSKTVHRRSRFKFNTTLAMRTNFDLPKPGVMSNGSTQCHTRMIFLSFLLSNIMTGLSNQYLELSLSVTVSDYIREVYSECSPFAREFTPE